MVSDMIITGLRGYKHIVMARANGHALGKITFDKPDGKKDGEGGVGGASAST